MQKGPSPLKIFPFWFEQEMDRHGIVMNKSEPHTPPPPFLEKMLRKMVSKLKQVSKKEHNKEKTTSRS